MKNHAPPALALLLFALVACKPSADAEPSEPANAEQPKPTAAAPPPSATSPMSPVEIRVPRESATKLIELCESPTPSSPPDPAASAKPPGETAVPDKDPQKETTAARLFGLRPGSPLDKAKLQNGDRIVEINGVAPGAPKERWDHIRQSNRLDVSLIRRGAPMKMVLIVE